MFKFKITTLFLRPSFHGLKNYSAPDNSSMATNSSIPQMGKHFDSKKNLGNRSGCIAVDRLVPTCGSRMSVPTNTNPEPQALLQKPRALLWTLQALLFSLPTIYKHCSRAHKPCSGTQTRFSGAHSHVSRSSFPQTDLGNCSVDPDHQSRFPQLCWSKVAGS